MSSPLNVKYDLSIQNKRLRVCSRPQTLTRRRSRVVEEEEEVKIPADVCGIEILSYLPGRKLQTLKIVCKDWLQLITSSDEFIRLHLSKSIQNRIRVLMTKLMSPTIIEYNNYDKENCQQIAFPSQFHSCTKILSSANGLVFYFPFLKHALGLGVFNPSTGNSFVAQLCPSPPNNLVRLFPSFGDLGGGEYVLVVGILNNYSPFETWVYKFTRRGSDTMNRTCSTQNTIRTGYVFLVEKGTFVRGVVHWPVQYGDFRYTILAYNIGENKHMEISPPDKFNSDCRIGVFVDGCSLLATTYICNVAEIWIMKQEENCWTKYATIGPGNNFVRMNPLGFFPNGDLIMDVDKRRLMKYSFNYHQATLLMDYGQTLIQQVIVCADGLLSPDSICY